MHGCAPQVHGQGLSEDTKPKGFVPRKPIVTKPNTNRDWSQVRVEMLSSSTTTDFSRCRITSGQNGRKETEQQVNPSWHTWQPRPCWPGPQGSVLRTRPGWTCAQTKPLLFAHTQLRSRTGWHAIPDPRTLGLTNGKTNQDCRAPLGKLAAKLQANLEEQVYWCQPWTTGVPHLPDTPTDFTSNSTPPCKARSLQVKLWMQSFKMPKAQIFLRPYHVAWKVTQKVTRALVK